MNVAAPPGAVAWWLRGSRLTRGENIVDSNPALDWKGRPVRASTGVIRFTFTR